MSITWKFWSLGIGLMVVGVMLLSWAMLWDRPKKGQKRCPKCWYDLSHPGSASDPLRCSECGHQAKKQKHLSRTRRKWRWAALGILILGSGLYSSAIPKAKRDGWLSFVPDSILILCITSDTNSWAAIELHSRLFPTPPPQVMMTPARYPVHHRLNAKGPGHHEHYLEVLEFGDRPDGGRRDASELGDAVGSP